MEDDQRPSAGALFVERDAPAMLIRQPYLRETRADLRANPREV